MATTNDIIECGAVMENKGLQVHGPLFKPRDQYLTREGYPLGTECWYVHVRANGLIKNICGDTPGEALLTALAFLQSEWMEQSE